RAHNTSRKSRATRPQGAKLMNHSSCPPGAQHSGSFKAITARQLQALVRQHSPSGKRDPLVQLLYQPPAGVTIEPCSETIVRVALNDGPLGHLACGAVLSRVIAIPESAERQALVA